MAITGCAAHQNMATKYEGKSAEEAFADVTDARHFWLRDFEIGNDRAGTRYSSAPLSYKMCIVDESIKLSPQPVLDAVDHFLESKTQENYNKIIELTDAFGDQYLAEHGERPVSTASRICNS